MTKLVDSFQELNINNYDHDDVCRLNSWAIDAVDELIVLNDKLKVAIKAFNDIIDAANRM